MNKIKSLAVAVTWAVAAGSAQAQIATGATGNGELFLSVWDKVGAQSYVRDLGITMNSFGPMTAPAEAGFTTSVTPGAGFNQSWGTDATWATFTAGKTAAQINEFVWDVSALDHNGTSAKHERRYLTTSNDDLTAWPTTPLVQQPNNLVTQFGIVDQYLEVINVSTTGQPVSQGDTSVNGSGIFNFADGSAFMGAGAKLDNWGTNAKFNTTANVGTALDFYYITRSGSSNVAEASAYKYTNGTAGDPLAPLAAGNDATFMFTNDGMLTYQVAAVPEAETWAMFGAGLLMVGAIARRRMAS